ncbi:HET-domain-containing protein [Apiospora sp. TS-2023a]
MTTELDINLNRKNAFFYPEINITHDVRLLRVIQSGSGGAIKCRLLTVKLSELAQTRYRALSYVWGHATWLGALGAEQSENIRSLSLDRGKNCSSWSTEQWAGLRYLSYHPYWSRIWIIQEVLLATSMTIWCGCFVFPLSLLRSSMPRDAMTTRTMYDFKGRPTTMHHHISQSISPAEMVITHRLREVTGLRRDPLAQGTEVGTLEEMTRALQRPHSETVTYQSHIPDPLYQIMGKFGKLNCSDPRDKIYGLLGLLRERSSSLIQPDYEQGVEYAFSQALATGLEELLVERASAVPRSQANAEIGADGSFLTYYCDVRDAFGISDEESIPILRQLLEESQVWKRRNSTLNDEKWDVVRGLMQRDFEGLLGETSSAWSRHEGMDTENKFHRKLLGIW